MASRCNDAIRARYNLRSATGQDFGYDADAWRAWLDQFSEEELEAEMDRVFWSHMAKKGLSRFRWFHRPLTKEQVEQEHPTIRQNRDWIALQEQLQPGDEIWPFRYPRRNTFRVWGFRIGYLVLRRGEPIGGVVTMVS